MVSLRCSSPPLARRNNLWLLCAGCIRANGHSACSGRPECSSAACEVCATCAFGRMPVWNFFNIIEKLFAPGKDASVSSTASLTGLVGLPNKIKASSGSQATPASTVSPVLRIAGHGGKRAIKYGRSHSLGWPGVVTAHLFIQPYKVLHLEPEVGRE